MDTLDKELEAINRETHRYEFRRHLRGYTITQRAVPKPSDMFHVAVTGREQIAGRDVLVIAYRQMKINPAFRSSLPVPKDFGTFRS